MTEHLTGHSTKSDSPPNGQSVAADVKVFASTPLLFLLCVWMWSASKLGFSWSVLRLMQRGMQSAENKLGTFKGFQPTERDLFVCTYSKSGTNWALQIAYQIAQRGAGTFDHIHDVVPWPEAPMPDIVPLHDDATWRNTPTEKRVIKTHLESQYVPYNPEAKYIVIVRDPKDIFVSSYHFTKGMVAQGRMVPVKEWLDAYLSDEFLYGSWAEHVAGFWPWRERENVLFLTYAKMKSNPVALVQRVADFMGVELSQEEFQNVVALSSFSAMKSMDEKFAPRKPYPFNHLLSSAMMRQGETGSSKELLSPEEEGQIDDYMQAELARWNSDFPYVKMFVEQEQISAG